MLNGKDVSGYSYSISVVGVEKTSFKVIGDTTVNVAFTKKAAGNSGATSMMSCMGSIGSATGVILGVMVLGVVAVIRKKTNGKDASHCQIDCGTRLILWIFGPLGPVF